MNEPDKPVAGSQALKWAVEVLTGKGQKRQAAWLEGRLLLSKAWNKKGIDLVTALNDFLAAQTWNEYRDLVTLRAQGEPLQYLLGEQEFMGLPFKVSPEVLIPRWDTEILVNEALQEAEDIAAPRILDLGTGSGAIAVSLAYYLPQALVWASDISQEALEVARENAGRLNVADRITFVCGNLFAPLKKEVRFDLIVSNPPYISEKEYMTLDPEVKKEPCGALCGGKDGLDYYHAIGAAAGERLLAGGRLLMEIGWKQGSAVSKILQENNFGDIRIIKDWGGHDRVIAGKYQVWI